jgi:hypothetical protein
MAYANHHLGSMRLGMAGDFLALQVTKKVRLSCVLKILAGGKSEN